MGGGKGVSVRLVNDDLTRPKSPNTKSRTGCEGRRNNCDSKSNNTRIPATMTTFLMAFLAVVTGLLSVLRQDLLRLPA
jgi:hypothetical protein